MSDNTPPPIYDQTSIISHERLFQIRGNPTKFVDDLEAVGQTQTAKEALDNCIDEIALMGDQGYFIVTLCRDAIRQTYQLIVRDNGRGIPLGVDAAHSTVFVDAVTKPATSGKFNQDAYATAAGLFGQGLKEVAGFSLVCRVITHRPEATGSLLIRQGNHDMVPEFDPTPNDVTGVTVAYEIDPAIFTGIAEYAETGYIAILDLLKRYVFFRHYNIQFRLNEAPIPEAFWTGAIQQADAIISAVENKAITVWDSTLHDPEDWIRTTWNLSRAFSWKREYRKPIAEKEGLQDYIIRLYYARGEKTGDRFSLVNNVPIITYNSDNLAVVLDLLRQNLSEKISETPIRQFFLKEYRIPIFIATDIKYKGAKFAGATKYAFRDVKFREVFRTEVSDWFASDNGQDVLSSFYELVEEDIRARYNESLGGKITPKDQGRLFMQLARPDKYKPCSAEDRSATELFLVEGESAGGSAGYDTETQAIYKLGGKTLNVITSINEPRSAIIKRFKANPILNDILLIINYDLEKPNLLGLNFKRCCIMSDGDSHGRHIAATVTGNFHAVAPELVASGFFSVVAPPYYKVTPRKKTSPATYVREDADLVQWFARMLYHPAFEVEIRYLQAPLSQKVLTLDEFVPFCERVVRIGQLLDNLNKDLSVPQLLIEAFTRCTYYLSPKTMNIEVIQQQTGADRVDYDKPNHSLILTIGMTDYIIPLHNVAERIYDTLMPLLQQIRWRDWIACVTTKRTGLYQQSPMTLYQLYCLFKNANEMVQVKPLKGIGSMKAEDAATTCMNPRNRRLYSITDPGDVETIFNLLGDDSAPRKQLLVPPFVSEGLFR